MDNRLVEDPSHEVCEDVRYTGNWEDGALLFDPEYDSEEEDERSGKQEIVLTYEYM